MRMASGVCEGCGGRPRKLQVKRSGWWKDTEEILEPTPGLFKIAYGVQAIDCAGMTKTIGYLKQ